MTDLEHDPIGTKHAVAQCCWCQRSLTVAQVEGLRCWLCPACYPRQIARRVTASVSAKQAKAMGVPAGIRCLNVPLPSQVLFEETQARYVLWGGQAGPGKSHGVRWWLYSRSLTTKGHTALLLRETNEELIKTHVRFMREEVPRLGGIFKEGPPASAFFPSTGAYIDCGHMSDLMAIRRYLGTDYGAIVAEEGSTYPLTEDGISPLGELSGRARKYFPHVQSGLPVAPVFIVASNPGGPSSQFLLDFFIDKAPDYSVYPHLKGRYHPEQFVYLPARLEDNPYIKEGYEDDLALNAKWRYEQLRHGDWRVFAGQFFSTFRESHHVRDLGNPSGVEWFRSMDWGFHAPGAVGWWGILPDHRLYIRTDWKFQGLDEPDVARGIKKVDAQLYIKDTRYTAGDPAMWAKTGASHQKGAFIGRSIAQTLAHYGINLVKADHDRVLGWKRLQSLLRDAPDGVPWLILHPDASYLRRTIPAAKSDRSNPEDVDTTGDDHALDMARYGAMSPAARRDRSPATTYVKGSMGDLRDRALRENSKVRRFGRVA